MDVRGLRRCLDLGLRAARLAVGDVLADRRVEQERLLADDRGVLAIVVHAHVAQVLAVDEHAPLLRIVEPHEQIERRRLAGAGRADERDREARAHLEVHAAEDRILAVGEPDVLELDLAAQLRQRLAPVLALVDALLQDPFDAVEGAHRLHQRVVGAGQALHVLVGRRERKQHGGDRRELDLLRHEHEVAQHHQQRGEADLVAQERLHHRPALRAQHAYRAVEERVVLHLVFAQPLRLEAEGLHGADAREDLVHRLGGVAHRLESLRTPPTHALAGAIHRDRHQRDHQREHDERLRHHERHDDHVADDHHRIDEHVVGSEFERALQHLRVVRDVGDQLAHAALSEVAQRQRQDVLRDRAAEVRDHLDREVARRELHEVDADAAEDAAQRGEHRRRDDEVHRGPARRAGVTAEPEGDLVGLRLEPDRKPVAPSVLAGAAEDDRRGSAGLGAHRPDQRIDEHEGSLREQRLEAAEQQRRADQGLVRQHRLPDAAQEVRKCRRVRRRGGCHPRELTR